MPIIKRLLTWAYQVGKARTTDQWLSNLSSVTLISVSQAFARESRLWQEEVARQRARVWELERDSEAACDDDLARHSKEQANGE